MRPSQPALRAPLVLPLAFALAAVSAPGSAQSTCPPWNEQAELWADDGQNGDNFGISVAVQGDTAFVGANRDDEAGFRAGAAYVFQRTGTTWTQVAKLMASDAAADDRFGQAVALDGDTAAIGSHFDDVNLGTTAGSAYVFRLVGGTWVEEARLVMSVPGVVDNFGYAVALSGDVALVGAPRDKDLGQDAGSATVFRRTGTSWVEEDKLLASNGTSGDAFGDFVALDGDTAVVSSRYAAHVFHWDGLAWTEEAILNQSAAGFPGFFGGDVAVRGDTAIVTGSIQHPVLGTYTAAVVFERTGSSWTAVDELRTLDPLAQDSFGGAVSFDGDLAVVSAPGYDGGVTNSGAVFAFERVGGIWFERAGMFPSQPVAFDEFGSALALWGNTAIAGGWRAKGNTIDSGAAAVFTAPPEQGVTYCTAGTSASGCQASISAFGVPSASAVSGFCLAATNVEGAKNGLFFYGTNGRQANPWGNGTSYVCVVPPRWRGELLVAVGSTAGACDGSLAEDLNARWCSTCPKPAHNPGAGALVQAQLWYRDPSSTSNQTSSMSDAIEFAVAP